MILCLLEVIGLSSRISLQLTRPGQHSSACKRTFQSSSLPRIGPQEALISIHWIIGFGPKSERMACHRTHSNLEESLEQSLVRAVERLPEEVLRQLDKYSNGAAAKKVGNVEQKIDKRFFVYFANTLLPSRQFGSNICLNITKETQFQTSKAGSIIILTLYSEETTEVATVFPTAKLLNGISFSHGGVAPTRATNPSFL
ncbi:unnamed protein product [Nezara viridula]|uniref:Uncharacterized protein n=1 Tax=Nezara viridula TaxID=85310 RepID=A0A9P0E579_NEZVI|nr:unnamed protein product [Nezara viridula]